MNQNKARAIAQAGTQLAKVAAMRLLKSGSPKVKREDILNDPDVRQGPHAKPG